MTQYECKKCGWGLTDDAPCREMVYVKKRNRCPICYTPFSEQEPKDDPVEHPSHYTQHPSGVECIQVTEHFNFNVGNAIKYLWRHKDKGNPVEDLKKARFYVDREIGRIAEDGGV